MENFEDFQDAREFQKYAHEKGDGQVCISLLYFICWEFLIERMLSRSQLIPEACCILDEEKDIALFKPADENCIYSPSTKNSNMDKV